PGITDRLLHGEIVPGSARAHEATDFAVDHGFPVELGRAMNLATKPKLGIFVGLDDAGFRLAQRGEHLLGAIADRGHDTHPRYDPSSHGFKSSMRRRLLYGSGAGRSGFAGLEQADPEVLGGVKRLAIGLEPAIAGAEGEFAADHAL